MERNVVHGTVMSMHVCVYVVEVCIIAIHVGVVAIKHGRERAQHTTWLSPHSNLKTNVSSKGLNNGSRKKASTLDSDSPHTSAFDVVSSSSINAC